MKRATVALVPRPAEKDQKRPRTQLLVHVPSLGGSGQQNKTEAHLIEIENAGEDPSAIAAAMEDAQAAQSCEIEDDESMAMVSEVIAQHMDITEPLTTLRSLLEQRLGVSLANYAFYLQDTQELDSSKNLVNQCVQGEGLVQINLEISDKGGVKKINIVDVLKPADEVAVSQDAVTTEETEQVVRWVVSQEFKEQQEKAKLPNDPTQWVEAHVKLWIEWAIGHFGLVGVIAEDWNITGKQLCELSHSEFASKVPCDPGDLFWTHLELLRKCQIVAVVQQPTYVQQLNQIFTTVTKSFSLKKTKGQKVGAPRVSYEGGPGSRTGNNGQIQLWQFLLEMLTDKDCRDFIRWLGEDGEFKLLNPEMVAQLWGLRKNKPTMNYEKLSRALRYYYDGDMIAKVHGKRFVYKFVCDLKNLLGYSAAELNRLVEESFNRRLRSQDCQILVPISASGLNLGSGDS